LAERLKRITTESEKQDNEKVGGSDLNKKALSGVQKPRPQDFDARILQPIPHDPVTFVNIISYEKIQLRTPALFILPVPYISFDIVRKLNKRKGSKENTLEEEGEFQVLQSQP